MKNQYNKEKMPHKYKQKKMIQNILKINLKKYQKI